ncbi:hypothetical protein [Acidiphilium sp.]|uniref:hypothetical protein n=1 Tax=Acidiphilium sp. TaxID=527 RepID=UPI003D076ADD
MSVGLDVFSGDAAVGLVDLRGRVVAAFAGADGFFAVGFGAIGLAATAATRGDGVLRAVLVALPLTVLRVVGAVRLAAGFGAWVGAAGLAAAFFTAGFAIGFAAAEGLAADALGAAVLVEVVLAEDGLDAGAFAAGVLAADVRLVTALLAGAALGTDALADGAAGLAAGFEGAALAVGLAGDFAAAGFGVVAADFFTIAFGVVIFAAIVLPDEFAGAAFVVFVLGFAVLRLVRMARACARGSRSVVTRILLRSGLWEVWALGPNG